VLLVPYKMILYMDGFISAGAKAELRVIVNLYCTMLLCNCCGSNCGVPDACLSGTLLCLLVSWLYNLIIYFCTFPIGMR
jgi:hypothetical protein